MTGRDRKRPNLEQALAASREGHTLVVPKLDRLARSVDDVPAARWVASSVSHGGLVGDDLVAEVDALVGDVDARAGDQLRHLSLRLAAEGAT